MCRDSSNHMQRTEQKSADGFYFAPVPMLLLDSGGTLVDVNAACRVLMGLDLAGAKSQHFGYLEERLNAKAEAGLFPAAGVARKYCARPVCEVGTMHDLNLDASDFRVAVTELQYRSDRFGAVALRVSELPRVDRETGACLGSTISLDILDMEETDAYRRAVEDRLAHEVMWEVYAAVYDHIPTKTQFYQTALKRHRTALAPDQIHTVLDLGAGTGNLAFELLRLGKKVTAVELGRAMLDKLHKKRKRRPELDNRLRVIEDTAEVLPHLDTGSFDGVSVLLALFDMNHPKLALKEAIRVLKPGGVLVITEPCECFDLVCLMSAVERSLRQDGLFDCLASDWKRIQSVAPHVGDAVQHPQEDLARADEQELPVEAIRKILQEEGFSCLSDKESHDGYCATMTWIKPTESEAGGRPL